MAAAPTGQFLSRRAFLGGVVGSVAVVASGCGFSGNDDSGSDGAKVLNYTMGNVPAIDPQYVNNGAYLVPMGLLEGLVLQNDKGTGVEPAVAEKWEVSDDGLEYTFQIRDSAKWSNGKKITANDFEWTYQRLLTPSTAGATATLGANAYRPSLGIKNARDFLAGTLTDWKQVGVQAVDDKTLKMTLAAPNADFLMGLAHVSMVLLNREAIEADPKGWPTPEKWVGNGSFNLKSWTVNTEMVLVPNKEYWDAKNVHLDQIKIRFFDDVVARLQAYRNNEADITQASAREVESDANLKKEVKRLADYSTIYLATMWSQNPTLRDIRVRKALSLALNREELAKVDPSTTPGLSLMPRSVPGWNDSLATKFQLDEAKSLLAEAGYPDGKGLPTVNILAGVAGTPPPILDAIGEMWKANLGINVKLEVVESGVYVEKRWKVQPANYIGFYYGSFATTSTLNSWVISLWGPEFTQQFSLPPAAWDQYQKVQADKALSPEAKASQLAAILAKDSSPEAKAFADAANKAAVEQNQDEQVKQFVAAAKLREENYLFLPLVWGSIYLLAKPKITGLQLRGSPEYFYFKGIDIK